MTKREAAIVTAYTGFLIGDFHEFHKYAEDLMERPIFTHEFGDKTFMEKIKVKTKSDFVNIKIEESEDNIT